MSLARRLTIKTGVLILAVLVVAGVALWGLGGLNRDLDAALGEYRQLKELYALSNSLATAKAAYRRMPDRLSSPEHEHKVDGMRRLLVRVDQLEAMFKPERYRQIQHALGQALVRLDQEVPGQNRYAHVSLMMNEPLGLISSEIFDRNQRIEQIQREAQAHRASVQVWVAVTALLAALLAIAVGVWQYLAVMNPLRRLGRGVRLLARGQFEGELEAAGDREFVALASDFNSMAKELAALYEGLEDKVRLRSAQLAQSERLASVGFLAAGVAHEINNPLAIMAGEAELALQGLPDQADPELRQALATVRDEAFRCKGITQKLLSLARPGSGVRELTDLHALAVGVSEIVRTLPQYVGRSIEVRSDAQAWAMTDPAQIKQVLMNLVVNALEAVTPEDGPVEIIVGRSAGTVSIAVRDRGKGLSVSALGRIFEPFYTERKSPTTPGLGLGLSISHAMIEDLGGRLTAASEGLGQGSVFVIELESTEPGTTG